MASKAKLVTRTATSSSVTSDNIAKDAALTHAELDSNLINLRDQSFGVVADDSATIDIKAGDSLYIQGGTGITTSTNSDGTVTINSAGSGDITSVVAGDGLTGGATTGDATLNIGAGTGIDVAADAISVDVSDFLANGSNNRVVTATGTDALNGEANLTFDGSTLGVTGNITATTSIANDAITIDDNEIRASRSNDNILIDGNGTGRVDIRQNLADATLWSDWNGDHSRIRIAGLSREDLSVDADTVGREYGVGVHLGNKLTNGSSSNSNWRPRALVGSSTTDMNGQNYTRTGITRGPNGINFVANAINSSSSSDSTLKASRGASIGAVLSNYSSPSRNITQNTAIGVEAYVGIEGNGSGTATMDEGYGVYSSAYTDKSGGSATVTDFYAYYVAGGGATNHYSFYTDTDTSESRVGTLERYREKLNTLTSSSTITVDCGLSPVHKVTLATNTEFNIANLGTGQSVTLIITQDGVGNRTATFGTDGSTAVKFAGTYTALSTAAGAIDVVTIFNDGTNFLGNCAKAYA